MAVKCLQAFLTASGFVDLITLFRQRHGQLTTYVLVIFNEQNECCHDVLVFLFRRAERHGHVQEVGADTLFLRMMHFRFQSNLWPRGAARPLAVFVSPGMWHTFEYGPRYASCIPSFVDSCHLPANLACNDGSSS